MRILYNATFALLLAVCFACAHSPDLPLNSRQMNAAVREGAAALPYFVYGQTSLQDLETALENAHAGITLNDTYQAVYQLSLKDAGLLAKSDPVFDSMESATHQLRRILKSKDVQDSESYLITAIDMAVSDGFVLMAAIYRPEKSISVFNKYNFLARQTLTKKDPEFFRAYRTDVSGDPQDTIYDWAALPLDCVACQACQALFLTLTANKILEKKAKEDYWPQERQWIAGSHLSVLIRQDMIVSQALGVEKGFTQNLNIGKR